MPRTPRKAPGDVIYHVLNRGVGRMDLFRHDADYQAFENILAETRGLIPIRVLAWCLMRNHWHLVLWPFHDGDLARFMQRLTITHARRWALFREREGYGHVYQGRFKSFPVQSDAHLRTVCRYVERNALRARVVTAAQEWRWGSLWSRHHPDAPSATLLCPWQVPVEPLPDWTAWVNEAQSMAEIDAVRICIKRGRPYGLPDWVSRTAARLELESSMRPLGRPKSKEHAKATGQVADSCGGR
ncbi:MAG: transposase [Tepidisphaerales bacterium]